MFLRFQYVVTRKGYGGGHSPFFLDSIGARSRARTGANFNLELALKNAIEPVHCPRCGLYHPEMVQELRRLYGRRIDPNRFANQRLALPLERAWQLACSANTLEIYSKLIDIWPTLTWHAKKRLWQLSPLRKAMSVFYWGFWGVAVVTFSVMMALAIFGAH